MARLPSNQNTIAGSDEYGSAKYWTSPTRAEKNEPSTTPPSTTMSIDEARPSVRAKRNPSATRPNTKAPPTRKTVPRPSSRAMAPPSDAPDETPMMSGLTSGLRKVA